MEVAYPNMSKYSLHIDVVLPSKTCVSIQTVFGWEICLEVPKTSNFPCTRDQFVCEVGAGLGNTLPSA